MKEKASIESSLHVLKQEKEATAASKEAAIFEEAAAEYEEGRSLSELQDLALEDPKERTKDYIENSEKENLIHMLHKGFKMLCRCHQLFIMTQ